MKNRFTWAFHPVQAALGIILFFTLLGVFYSSLRSIYAEQAPAASNSFYISTGDLHGDLIKTVLPLPPFGEPDIAHWSPRYQQLYRQNPYIQVDLQTNDLARFAALSNVSNRVNPEDLRKYIITTLHLPPALQLVSLLLKKLLLQTSPQFLVELFYAVALISLGTICVSLSGAKSLGGAFAIYAILLLSPFPCRSYFILRSVVLLLLPKEALMTESLLNPALLLLSSLYLMVHANSSKVSAQEENPPQSGALASTAS